MHANMSGSNPLDLWKAGDPAIIYDVKPFGMSWLFSAICNGHQTEAFADDFEPAPKEPRSGHEWHEKRGDTFSYTLWRWLRGTGTYPISGGGR